MMKMKERTEMTKCTS